MSLPADSVRRGGARVRLAEQGMSGWHRAGRVPARAGSRRGLRACDGGSGNARRCAGRPGSWRTTWTGCSASSLLSVAAAARALYCPTARLSDLFGLDRPLGQDDWVDEHDAVTDHAVEPSTG
jgi:hypothetical protein